MNDEIKSLIFEVCNDWVAKGFPCTHAIHECFLSSTGDRDKYPHPLDALAKLTLSEAAESDALEQARLNGMGASREAALMAKLEAAEKERDALRADVETAHVQMMTSAAAIVEACAKACERLTKPSGPVPGHPIDAWLLATLDCAKVIRALGSAALEK